MNDNEFLIQVFHIQYEIQDKFGDLVRAKESIMF